MLVHLLVHLHALLASTSLPSESGSSSGLSLGQKKKTHRTKGEEEEGDEAEEENKNHFEVRMKAISWLRDPFDWPIWT